MSIKELSVQFIKGVGPKRALLLKNLGIHSAKDILYYLPFRYEDRRCFRKIRDLVVYPKAKNQSGLFASPPELQTVLGRVISKAIHKTKTRGSIFELVVTDGSGILRAKWFNQPFMEKRFKPSDNVVLCGIVRQGWDGRAPEMENPEYEVLSEENGNEQIHTGRVVPIYRASEGLSSRQIRTIVHETLKSHLHEVIDPVPEEIIRDAGVLPLREALLRCHFPPEPDDHSGRDRIAFDELLLLELGLCLIKKGRLRRKGIMHTAKGTLIQKLRQRLHFKLTPAQENALAEILKDMQSPYPMNRLLQGDVGSGKTIVALMAMLFCIEAGYQACLMAPTELLAEQHYLNIRRLTEGLSLNLALITSGTRQRPLNDIASGTVHLTIGTHALLEQTVRFSALGLAVIDEQHRFGVRQRAALRQKGAISPDVLVMTATPIPRTLSLTVYGDLDVSKIEGLPPGRTEVETLILRPEDKKKIYSMIAEEIRLGGQVYVVYPVIEGAEGSSLKSAVLGEQALKKVFPMLKIALIHGKMKPELREKVMLDFKAGVIDILVCTTVIEVGVDVPNASLMIIVHAERFGLAQLHQLRGRVGRGRRHSKCVLVAHGAGEDAQRRLRIMVETKDGFRIAEEDLIIRGPGELLGTRQSGMPDLKVADIIRDSRLVEVAGRQAEAYLAKDPLLTNAPYLRAKVEEFWHGKTALFGTA